jgi:hypothetical protein
LAKQHKNIFKNYIEKQTGLVSLLKANGARVALVTPQPIEDKRPDPDKDVRNESLRKMSDGLREVATKEGVLFADQFDPYMAVMLKARQADPNAARQPQPHTFVLKPAAPSDLKQ